MAPPGDAGDRLRAQGWQQGSILSPEACEKLKLLRPERAQYGIVLSQDCDVVAACETEDVVEVIAATFVEQVDPSALYGKHPRRLAVALDGSSQHFELNIRHRTYVAKPALAEFEPLTSFRVTRRDVRIMARWIAKRYTRDAFPDAFNLRLLAAKRPLEKLSKSESGRSVTQVFIAMAEPEDELPPDQPYRIALWFAFRDDPSLGAKRRADAERFASSFLEALRSCAGIDVSEETVVRSHAEISLEELESMKRFDLDFRSFAPKPGGDSPPSSVA